MPCINARKKEIQEISKRFPDQFERIAEWEFCVSVAAKREAATFFASVGDTKTAFERGNIREVVKWSKTLRGGKIIDPNSEDDAPMCSSAYGLCE